MAPRRGRYVRPLLAIGRAELLDYARQHGLRWMEDPSNVHGTRGAIRHRVLPELEAIRRGAARGIVRSSGWLAQDDALLQELAAGLLDGDGARLAALQSAPAPLARRAVLQLVRRAAGGLGNVEARHVDALLAGRGVQLPGGWSLCIDDGVVRCVPKGRDIAGEVSTCTGEAIDIP